MMESDPLICLRRNLDHHPQPAPALAAEGEDAALVEQHDAAADGEAEAAAFVRRAGRAEAHEALEDMAALVGAEAGTLVFHAHAPHAVLERRVQRDAPFR